MFSMFKRGISSVIGAVFLISMVVVGANAFEKKIESKDGFEITISSPKNFTAGKNSFDLILTKNGAQIADLDSAKVAVRFSMPEMPGMPKMSEDASISLESGALKGVVSFPHGGTWQIRVNFEVDGVKYQAKSSIDF
ncbi:MULTISPECIES: FixH family protein [unclassified Helicobacter]|uniref:FixH family protein n=1 Tax=unclassified Helicobacter TaxID=2593540 RepID=UPI0009ED76D1|nr:MULTISPECIES: FixH family protein [unclassified Helicobacter]